MKSEERKKAIELRTEHGWSYGKIADTLKVSKGTISRWCDHIKLTGEQIGKLANNCMVNSIIFGMRNKYVWEEKRIELLKEYHPPFHDPDFMLGLGLYWGEGNKYNESGVGMANSDPCVLRIFKKWISQHFANDCIVEYKVRIMHYSPEKREDIIEHWSKELDLPINSIKDRIAVSRASLNKRGMTLPFGTAQITCKGQGVWKIRQKIGKALKLLT